MNKYMIFLNNIDNKFYKHNYYYLYSMSIYHVLVILFTLIIPTIPIKVFYKLTFTPQANNQIISSLSVNHLIWSYLLILSILILDVLFLYIIVMEFNPKWITIKRIGLIEGIILTISFLFPYLRDIFIFLSVNTLIISITYSIIKHVPYSKYLFLTGSYIYIIRLVTYPIFTLITLYIKFS